MQNLNAKVIRFLLITGIYIRKLLEYVKPPRNTAYTKKESHISVTLLQVVPPENEFLF